MNPNRPRPRKGNVGKLEQLSTVGSEEITTKELLTKEVVPNLLQSKFSIEVAGTALEQARSGGRDVTQAAELLEAAKDDSIQGLRRRTHDGATVEAGRRWTEGRGAREGLPTPSSAVRVPQACPTCGGCDPIGRYLLPQVRRATRSPSCPSCGASLLTDDAYCPKVCRPVTQEFLRRNNLNYRGRHPRMVTNGDRNGTSPHGPVRRRFRSLPSSR